MSVHNSRSRSPSTGVNGHGQSTSFGHQMSPGMDPQMFNNSPYVAGANFQNQGQFVSNQYMGDMQGGQQYDGSYNGLGVNGPGLMVDPQLQDGSINPGDIMGNQDQMSPTGGMQSGMNSQHHSPAMQSTQFAHVSPGHSRHASLDPASAGIGQGPLSEWMGQGHRRSPSEHSDVSSASHSPYQANVDQFDVDASHSPLLNPTMGDPSLYDQGLSMDRFNLQDAQRRASISAHNSPYISPNLVPVANNGRSPEGHFVLGSNGPQDYSGPELGQADMMAAPEINVEFAPPQNTMQLGDNPNNDALSPPQRGRTIRNRAKSDTSLGPRPVSRPLTPADLSPNLLQQPSLLDAGLNQPQRHRSLSPFDATFPANYRSASPGSARSSRRSSTSSINPNRDYILELADPNRPGASGTGTGTRVQKHPATFQCTMCPKRFTRAYNLRSHLRTHTDERPFVCSVCGKAFARQHDRKRHEGLHSGEKKFVCKGDLSGGQGTWGCGRRFARADALGRHFRSEAGRVCIKPLLDEEMAEKRRAWEQQVLAGQQMQHMGQMPPNGMPAPGVLPSQGPGIDPSMPSSGLQPQFSLPQAILQQYPALQGMNWDQIASGPAGMDDDEGLSGRSDFDASGGPDDFDDGYVSGPATMYGGQQAGWVSDQGM